MYHVLILLAISTLPIGVRLAPSTTCDPSTCDPNSECKIVVGIDHPICKCREGFIGASPNCRHECNVHSDCCISRACINNKCEDPCPGACGLNAFCEVMDHRPACKCVEKYYGDPYVRCKSETEAENQMFKDPVVQNICEANPPACQ